MKKEEKYKAALLDIEKIADDETFSKNERDNLKYAWKQLDEISDIIKKLRCISEINKE